MMIKILTTVMFISLVTSQVAGATKKITSTDHRFLSRDTVFTPIAAENPIFPFQNIIFKKRLDSIQKTVSLDYNEYVQGYIDIYTNRKDHLGKMLGLSKYYFPIFEKALLEAGLPDELKFITIVESALNPHAVSRSGAVGPWQFMYTTARGYGLVMDNYVDERKDPTKASYAAAHYFLDAYKRIGDWLLTVAAFNCGTGAVTRAIEKSGGIADFWKVRPFLPRETQNYVPAFIATVYTMNYYQNHGIEIRPAGFNISTDILSVNRKLAISSIAKAAGLDVNQLLTLNPSYKKQIINGSLASPKTLVIPGVGNDVYAAIYDVLNGNESPDYPVILATANKTIAPAYHKVKPGQNLGMIANLYSVEVQDLKVWNGLKTNTVVPGQNIKISESAAMPVKTSEINYISYIVKAGDTLSGIADRFKGATVSNIKALNGLTKSTISPGMSLKINKL